jgi:hypothetical protein
MMIALEFFALWFGFNAIFAGLLLYATRSGKVSWITEPPQPDQHQSVTPQRRMLRLVTSH